MTVCNKCGLPEDLCVCESVAQSSEKIKIHTEKRRFGKDVTVINGISEDIDLKDLSKKLKTKLACGGTHKEGRIELQGSHADRAKEILIKLGFPEEQIEA